MRKTMIILSRRTSSLFVFGVSCAFVGASIPVRAESPTETRFTLDNGIRVVVLHAKGSTHFAAISFLPLGLATDGAGRTQWSHLVEHLTLRTTGPITSYKERNAETLPDCMHLDFLGSTDNWRTGLDLQAKWLSGLPFSREALEEEVPKALAEVKMTEANLFTHKWAAAAWNQVVRHGRTNVDVFGDLKTAKLGDVQAYRDQHFALLDRVVLCIVGGVPADTLKPEIEKRFGALRSVAKALPIATSTKQSPRNQTATWDLSARHYIQYYAIPGPDHEDYATLYLGAMLLNSRFFMDHSIKQSIGTVFCGVDLVAPEGAYLYISASFKPDVPAEKVATLIAEKIRELAEPAPMAQIQMLAMNLSMQLSAPSDLDAALRVKPAQVSELMIVGNLGLQWGLHEYRYGEHRSAIAAAIRSVDHARVAAVAKKYLSNDKRRTLLLRSK